jgi:probable HAF family extracellular repeat protein
MKTILNSIAASAVLAAVAFAQTQHYTITDLGKLPGGTFSQAWFIDSQGLINGVADAADGTQHAIVWQGGRMIDLAKPGFKGQNSGAFGINARGQAEVQAEIMTKDPNNENFCTYGTGLICRAFRWQGGLSSLLPTLGGNNSSVGIINSRGQIAGVAERGNKDPACTTGITISGTGPQVLDFGAVIWGPKPNEIRELYPLPGDSVAMALGINDDGQAVGGSGSCSNTVLPPIAVSPHATLWEKDGTVLDLGNLGGTIDAANAIGTTALSINNLGQVAGVSALAGNSTVHAFLWTSDAGMRDVGTLPGDFMSVGTSVNDSGQVVGESDDKDFNARAYIWQNGAIADLNTLVPATTSLVLLCGTSINANGQIAGFGVQKSAPHEVHAFLATPAGVATATPSEKPTILPEDVRARIQKRRHYGKPY